MRENECRPYGSRVFVPLHPVLPRRAFTFRRYTAGVLVVHTPPLAFNGSSHAHTVAREISCSGDLSRRGAVIFLRLCLGGWVE